MLLRKFSCVDPQVGCTIMQLACFRVIFCRACLYLYSSADLGAHMDVIYRLGP